MKDTFFGEPHLTYPGITHLRFQDKTFEGHECIEIPEASKRKCEHGSLRGYYGNLGWDVLSAMNLQRLVATYPS